MTYKKLIVLRVLTVVTVCMATTVNQHGFKSEESTMDVYYLGTVDGKSYYAENLPQRTWAEAKQFCEDFGMRLASITTQNENDFLVDKWNISSFTDYYWTSGRDSLKLSNFVWDYTDQEVESYGLTFYHVTGVYSCLRYLSHWGNGAIEAAPCFLTYGTLCEITHAKHV